MNRIFSDEATIERVATALEAAAVAEARDRIAKQSLSTERIVSAVEIARQEADRSAAILLFALAEDMMLECFKANMNPEAYGGWEGATGGNGVLATAAGRITLLELLYWIRPSTGADLRLMKSIRNRFAHHYEVHAFQEQKVLGWLSSMTQHDRIALSAHDETKSIKLSSRNLFMLRAVGTLFRLAQDLAVGPVARQQRVNPASLTGGAFEEQPENIKDAYRNQAALSLAIAVGQGSFDASSKTQ